MNKQTFAALCCMAMLAGCQQAEEIENMSEKLPMGIEASIENTAESRYASGNENGTPSSLKFTKGDNIGIFVDNKAANKWTKEEGNSWIPTPNPVYWPDKVNEHNFYAFYPYQEATSKTSVPMPHLNGQNGTIESLSACDFMIATSLYKKYDNNGTVSFTGENCFTHVSSLIAITILKESDLKESTITKISFNGKPNTGLGSTTTYSFETETVTTTTNQDYVESATLEVSMAEAQTNKTLYFILNNGANLADITFSIEYKTGTTIYQATKAGLGDSNLIGGNRYNFNLNITDGVLNISGNEIEGWGEGANMDDIIINTPTTQSTTTP